MNSKQFKIGVAIIAIITAGIIMAIVQPVSPVLAGTPVQGEFGVMGNFDFNGDNEDIFIQHLGLSMDADNAFVSIIMDRTEEFELDEAYVKTMWQDIEWQLGKVYVPFGFKDLDNPMKSVFIVQPRTDYLDYGLHLATKYDIMNLQGTYIDSDNYSLQGSLKLFDGGEIISVSYADSEQLMTWSINNEFYYQSLLFNFSNVIEYTPENGNIWTRSVIAPGILDVVGLTVGYYDIDSTDLTLWDYDMDQAFTYGFYFDIGEQATVSTEWKTGKSINMPTIKITSTF